MKSFTNIGAFTIACICLYSTGHWIGGSVMLAFVLLGLGLSKEAENETDV
jgi:hypothetical protein